MRKLPTYHDYLKRKLKDPEFKKACDTYPDRLPEAWEAIDKWKGLVAELESALKKIRPECFSDSQYGRLIMRMLKKVKRAGL